MTERAQESEPHLIHWRMAYENEDDPQIAVQPRGQVDLYNTPEVKSTVLDLMDMYPDVKKLNIDLSQTTFIDNVLLAAIMGFVKMFRERDGEVSIVCSDTNMCVFFQIAGLDRVLEIQPQPADGPVPNEAWQPYDRSAPQISTRLTIMRLGKLAGQIQNGLKTYEEQLIEFRKERNGASEAGQKLH